MCKADNHECREAHPLGKEKARTMKVANSRNLKRERRQLVKWQSCNFGKCNPLRILEIRKLTSCRLRTLGMPKNSKREKSQRLNVSVVESQRIVKTRILKLNQLRHLDIMKCEIPKLRKLWIRKFRKCEIAQKCEVRKMRKLWIHKCR